MLENPNVLIRPMEGQSYMVSFTMNGGSQQRGLLFNGEVGDPPALWFVSM
jgi:hypothetical protein